jgi:hypothetical protein
MKRFIPIILILSFFLSGTSGLNAQMTFMARLSGQQEVQPIATPASGMVTATLVGNNLTLSGSFDGLTGLFDATIAGGAHLHLGYAGENGPIEFMLTTTPDIDLLGGSFEAVLNTFTLTPDQLEALMDRRIYINIHTTRFPGGELRGQLLPEADAYYSAALFGSMEAPSIMTDASGGLQLELSDNELTVSGAFANLQGDFDANIAGGAHLHLALPGANGGVDILLNATTAPDLRSGFFAAEDNTFMLTSDQIEALENRNYYVNIHTTAFASGELRGQVVGNPNAVFRAHLSAVNEWPVVTSRASGQVILEIDGDQLTVSGTFDDLGSPVATDIAGGAHLHLGSAGSNGDLDIVLNLDLDVDMQGGAFLAADNQFTLDSDQLQTLYNREYYINIHTEENMAGELRGQVLNQSQYVLTAFLSGNQEVPDATTTGRGMLKVEVSGNTIVATGSFNELTGDLNVDIVGGAHIHSGLPGQNGDVVFPLVSEVDLDPRSGVFSAIDNRFAIDADQKAMLKARGMYVNIHSLTFPMGEIRGNLLAEANAYFLTPLSGASEAPAIRTNADGMIALEMTGENVVAVGSFQNLESDFDVNIAGGAHLHGNYAGSNGGVEFLLDATTDTDLRGGIFVAANNQFTFSSGQIDTLLQRGYYANLHTMDNGGGELRGQVLPLAQTYFHTTLMGLNEVPPVLTQAMGGLKFELVGTRLTLTGSFSGLESAYDSDIGSHLHLAANGSNGDVAISLNPELSADMLSGTFTAAANTFELTADQVEAIRSGMFYVNIHTENIASGELRGQVVSEINLFPEAAEITAPVDGALLDIIGAGSTSLMVTWNEAMDADEDELAYIWQLATDASFSTILLQQNVGNVAAFTTTYADVDALLAANDVEVGSSITLFHRVVVSDGSNSTAGEAITAEFSRGGITGTREALNNRFSLRAYPVLTTGAPVTVEVTADEATDARMIVTDGLGRMLQNKPVRLQADLNQVSLNINTYTSGIYYVTVQIDGRNLPAQKIIRQ